MQAHFQHYILRAFQWYKEHFNPMSFDPSNCSLNIWETIGIPSVWAHSLTLSHTPKNVNVTLGLHSWPTHFHALALVANPKLGL